MAVFESLLVGEIYMDIHKAIIGKIAKSYRNGSVSPDKKTKEVVSLFKMDNQLGRVVIVEHGKPIGLVMRDNIFYRLGSQFGYSLYMDKYISKIMNKNPLILDYNIPILRVSKLAMSRKKANLYDYIIITKEERYYGTVSIKELLIHVSQLKVAEARDLNPLTNLPGNRLIEEDITHRIKNKDIFSVLYLDLDNFKVFNDNYGYKKGDNIIIFTAELLRDAIKKFGGSNDFIGHIGGDDFLIVTEPLKDIKISEYIIEQFDKNVLGFFSEEDIRNGYMEGNDRMGHFYQMPLTSISIAIISNEKQRIDNHLQISDIAAELKKYVKNKAGSNYIKNRRSSY
ncbi:GGDEF domain-containing protein [Halocella sp. SP3-1]|nr:GGDEF domain-containing protein [Halocella sp. SP3-1]